MTQDGLIRTDNAPKIAVDDKQLELYRVLRDDLLVTRSGSIGTMAVFDGDYDAIPSAYLIRFRFSRFISVRFVYMYLRSPTGLGLLGLGTTRMAQPNINAISIRAIPFPLPPLSEQERIVAKIGQLMTLCDDLEAKLAQHRDQGQRLMQAVVEGLVA